MIARPALGGEIAVERATEIFPDGTPRAIGTAYLENGACPLACVYCALYRQAGTEPVSGAGIAAQIRSARRRLGAVPGIKLYNGSSLFEPRSIRQGEDDLAAIAEEVSDLDLVVVEARSEQARRAPGFARRLRGRLEVAIGLEVADDSLLEALGKPTTVRRFREAARALRAEGILLRAFVLVQPPFVAAAEAGRLARATFDLAVECGARVVSLLPVVSEHPPMEKLRAAGSFTEISREAYFRIVAECAGRGEAVVLAQTEVLDRLPSCPDCAVERSSALSALNATGKLPPVECRRCDPARDARPGTRS